MWVELVTHLQATKQANENKKLQKNLFYQLHSWEEKNKISKEKSRMIFSTLNTVTPAAARSIRKYR